MSTHVAEIIRDSRTVGAFRNVNAHIVGRLIRLTGYRFDKSWRHAERGPKAFVYSYLLSTVGANFVADGRGWRIH